MTQFVIDSLMTCDLDTDDYNAQSKFIGALCEFADESQGHIHVVAHSRKGKHADESTPPGKFGVAGHANLTNRAFNGVTVFRNKEKIDRLNEACSLKNQRLISEATQAEAFTRTREGNRLAAGFPSGLRQHARPSGRCAAVPIHHSTVYDEVKRNPDFAASVEDARRQGAQLLVKEATRRAANRQFASVDERVDYAASWGAHADSRPDLAPRRVPPTKMLARRSTPNTLLTYLGRYDCSSRGSRPADCRWITQCCRQVRVRGFLPGGSSCKLGAILSLSGQE